MRKYRAIQFLRIDDDHPLTGWHVFALIVLFFGTILTVNFAMAILATGTFPGLVVKNSYVASQNYNALLADARAQAEYGFSAQFAAKAGILQFRLADRLGEPQRRLTVTAYAGRPASANEDRALTFTQTGDSYLADTALPAGRWIVDVEARDGDTLIFRQSQPVWIVAASASTAKK